MRCSNCGKEISDKAVICYHCGNEIIKDNNQNLRNTQSKMVNKNLIIILGSISALLFIFCICLLVNNDDNISTISTNPPIPYSVAAVQSLNEAATQIPLPFLDEYASEEEFLKEMINYYTKVYDLAGYSYIKSFEKFANDYFKNKELLMKYMMVGSLPISGTPEIVKSEPIDEVVKLAKGHDELLKKYFSQNALEFIKERRKDLGYDYKVQNDYNSSYNPETDENNLWNDFGEQ